MIRRSVVMRSRMSGRCSLITASRPSGSTQACTWPIEAADSGDSSKCWKICDGARPRSLRIISRAVSPSNGGTSSRQRSAAFDSGAGKMPGDEAMSCPSFTNVGPSASKASMAPSDATVAHEPLRWRVSLAGERLQDAHREGEVDHHHPPELGHAELVERWRVHVEGLAPAVRPRTGPGSARPRPARRSRWPGGGMRGRGTARAPSPAHSGHMRATPCRTGP